MKNKINNFIKNNQGSVSISYIFNLLFVLTLLLLLKQLSWRAVEFITVSIITGIALIFLFQYLRCIHICKKLQGYCNENNMGFRVVSIDNEIYIGYKNTKFQLYQYKNIETYYILLKNLYKAVLNLESIGYGVDFLEHTFVSNKYIKLDKNKLIIGRGIDEETPNLINKVVNDIKIYNYIAKETDYKYCVPVNISINRKDENIVVTDNSRIYKKQFVINPEVL